MRNKVLKNYTRVPKELYVERGADEQLKNIIEDMGRPGYVLVARQMGKTNLLLNAKRDFQDEGSAYVYCELSNPFTTAQECFRDIIDTAIEGNRKFDSLREIIAINRNNSALSDHREHLQELVLLCRNVTGKLVIFLDEIDALTKANYSDQIFSLIRSIYFSGRENFPELEKLTYVLSGVAEPTELIKNPKISPFNIGQKIYLDDFSYEQFLVFIEKASISVDSECINRIYYWTKGNPRTTWDICSEVENELIKTDFVTVELIDNIVKKLYLTTFDRPPIDNIRELVINDREIRNSIVEISYNKSNIISDRVKSKLYLAGIINYNEKEVFIKNEIIKQSLNLDWIRTLEEDERGLINVAMEEYGKQKYPDALLSFEKFLEVSEFEENHNKPHYYYIMGHCSFTMENYEKAISYYDKCNFNIEDEPIWYYKVLSQKGLSYFFLNKYDESLKAYKSIIDNGRKDELYSLALLNFGSIALKSNRSEYKTSAIEIFNNIIDGNAFSQERLKPSFIDKLKSYAFYNLAQIKAYNNQKSEAISLYKNAFNYADPQTKPAIVLGILKHSDDKDERNEYLEKIANLILGDEIKPSKYDPDAPLEYSFENLKEILVECFVEFDKQGYERLSSQLSLLEDEKIGEHILSVALDEFNNENSDKGIRILNVAYNKYKLNELPISNESFFQVIKILSYFSDRDANTDIKIDYVNLFRKGQFSEIDFLDLEVFANLILYFTQLENYDKALEVAEVIEAVKNQVNESLLINYIAIYHLELNLFIKLGYNGKALLKASEIVKLANDEKIRKQNSNLLGEKGLELIKKHAESILYPKVEPINLSTTKLNRRERRIEDRKNKKR